jgi:hypothetical protein
METAGSPQMLAIGNMAPWHHNPADHNKFYFHKNPDLWLIQLLVVGQAFYVYDSPDYIAVFHSIEEMACKLVKARNFVLDIQFQGCECLSVVQDAQNRSWT